MNVPYWNVLKTAFDEYHDCDLVNNPCVVSESSGILQRKHNEPILLTHGDGA